MRLFLREDLERFLEAVDRALAGPVEVIVIGGSAAALHYGVTRATRDIDTWTTVQAELADAAAQARATTGLEVPLEKSGVADAPFDWALSRHGHRARPSFTAAGPRGTRRIR